MNKFLCLIGRAALYASWPVVYIILRLTRRTRVLIIIQDRVLVVKPWLSNGRWQLPGGGIKRRETPAQAAQRELREEVGLNLTADQLQPLDNRWVHEAGFYYRTVNFYVSLQRPPVLVRRKLELAEINWLSLQEINPNTCQAGLITVVEAWSDLPNLV